MANLFRGYEILDVNGLVRQNIRPDDIYDDVASLVSVLGPILYLTRNPSPGTAIHSDLVKRFEGKFGLIDLLKSLGYERNYQNDFQFFDQSDAQVVSKRRKASEELKKFNDELKRAKEGDFAGLKEFLSTQQAKRTTDPFQQRFDYERLSPRRQPFENESTQNRSRLPSSSGIREGNDKTLQLVRRIKEDVAKGSQYGRAPTGYIRRRFARLLLKQINPSFGHLDNETLDERLVDFISTLKTKCQTQNAAEDEVYIECLIRTHFDIGKAVQIFRTTRPVLKPPVVESQPGQTNVQSAVPHLRQQSTRLNGYQSDESASQVLLYAEDVWKNCVHVLPAIVQLREKFHDEQLVSKVHRLMFSEFSWNTTLQSELKISLLSYQLVSISQETLANVDMSDIKDILRSCSDNAIDDSFPERIKSHFEQECPICGSILPRSRIETFFLCGDTCCLVCAKNYYRTAIKDIRDEESLSVLTCYNRHSCPTDPEIRQNFFNHLESQFLQWFRDEKLLIETYHENVFIATTPANIVKCANPKCHASFELQQNRRRAAVNCPHCQFSQCSQCSRKWFDQHNGIECNAYEDWLADNDPDDPDVQLSNYLRTAGMICPNDQCQQIFEYRAGGCEHFTCSTCKTEFCRICSALFNNPKNGTPCQRATCGLKNTIHAHCFFNCFREIRDADIEDILDLLKRNDVNVDEEFHSKPVAQGPICPVDGCNNAASAARENRFCETCYKQFLCLLIWRQQIDPWSLYAENQLATRLRNAGVQVEDGLDKNALIELSRTHLGQFLGKPKRLPRIRR